MAEKLTGAARFAFPADHPAGPGHFPGNPIVPGALLLDGAVYAIAAATGAPTETPMVKSAKFLHPVRPGESVEVTWHMADPPGECRFVCALSGNGTPVLTGTLLFGEGVC